MLNYLSVVFYLYVIVRKFIHLISLRISQTFFELSVSNNAISHFRHMVGVFFVSSSLFLFFDLGFELCLLVW